MSLKCSSSSTLGLPLITWLLLVSLGVAFIHLCSFRKPDSDNNPLWDDFAIALKTGSDVALQRVPIQLLTFLSDVKNKIIIGDRPNVTVGDYEMIDVYTNLYNYSEPSLKKSKNF